MLKIGLSTQEQLSQLTQTIARRTLLPISKILPFPDIQDFLPQLFSEVSGGATCVIIAGHVTPDATIAADRAGLKVSEALGVSPFAASVDAALARITDGSELVYVANPNRVTGSNFGLADLEQLVNAVPSGFVIIDEYYYEYFGITGLTLLERHDNLCVLRSFAAGFGIGSSDSGFLSGSTRLIERLRERTAEQAITSTIYKTALMSLDNDSALDTRMRTLHDETMRVSTALTRLGLQNRITAADFLLLRVKEPTTVGNHLARYKVPCENLDGYPLLKGYLRYHVQSPQTNDRLLDAVGRMPSEQCRTTYLEKRITKLHHAPEVAMADPTPVIDRKAISIAKTGRRPQKTVTNRSHAVSR